MDFDAWLGQAWHDHADDAAGVAARLSAEWQERAAEPAHLAAAARLAQHVYSDHLGRWNDGQALLARMALHPLAGDEGAAAALRLHGASLALGGGDAGPVAALPPVERVRATALAAGGVAAHDLPRGAALFSDALAQAEALPDSGPHQRTLAIVGNNLACDFEELPARSAEQAALMILAAQTARRFWALAGGWLEIERAEYRLANTWLKAGDPARAREHAAQCLAIVQANTAPALERFFAQEVIGLAAAALGDRPSHAAALAEARAAFASLGDADRAGCEPTLQNLEAAGH